MSEILGKSKPIFSLVRLNVWSVLQIGWIIEALQDFE